MGILVTVHSGFRRGRLITDSVLELAARIMRGLYTGARCPVLILIGIKAAFPSVAWDWLWYVLDLMDCPGWLLRAVRALQRQHCPACYWGAARSDD